MTKQERAKQDYLAGMKYKTLLLSMKYPSTLLSHGKKRNGWVRGAPKQKSVHPKSEKVAPKFPDSDELNDKQKIFCLYYLQRYNATWAYQKTYGSDYETAMASGSRLLRNVKVKKYLAELKKQQSRIYMQLQMIFYCGI